MSGERGFDRIGEEGQRRLERIERDVAMLHPLGREADRRKQASEARVGGERAEQRLGADQLIGDVLDLLDRKEEQTVAREELTTIGTPHRLEQIRPRTGPLRECGGSVLSLAWRCAVDDDSEDVDILRK